MIPIISFGDFETEVLKTLKRDISLTGNPNQHNSINVPPNQSQFIVAGPGSGKTTVIALRVLKLILIDNENPSSILVTTFTRKAADELRSRILGWGDQLRTQFLTYSSYSGVQNQLERINFNEVFTGTLDSISEQILGDYRPPGAPPIAVIEGFVSKGLMVTEGLIYHGRHRDVDLRNYIIQLNSGSAFGVNTAYTTSTILEIKDRFSHDQVDIGQYRNSGIHAGVTVVCDAIHDYNQELHTKFLYDYARLEQEFLTRLQAGLLDLFLEQIKFLFVDEYQDTNLLQEQIYFQIASAALQNSGSLTVVGDDDQSLYRFRGATVDLFNDFPARGNNQLSITPNLIHLSKNYRSTSNIVEFCNSFINIDGSFQNARVTGKPPITPSRPTTPNPYVNYPILGMFRDNATDLAHDLAGFIHEVINGNGFSVTHNNTQYTIQIDPQEGSSTDLAVLCSSPKELAGVRERLPLLLRRELSLFTPQIRVFNPRGEHLQHVDTIQIVCGLVLECIDPNANIQDSIQRLPQECRTVFNNWRHRARDFIRSNPHPQTPVNLQQFVDSWQNRSPLGGRRTRWHGRGQTGRLEVPIIQLLYKIITWMPIMQNDPEGVVYLEAITRTINQAGFFGNFNSQMVFDLTHPTLESASIREAYWNIFVPLATGAIDVEEDLLETLPRDRLNIMSVHQAKGLEFPLVIVDVGSDFTRNHPNQAFKRYPQNGGNTCNMEDNLRPFSHLSGPTRPGIDRAFDDLIRQYFVSYSRAQDVLLLVGLNTVRDRIPNMATGWDRDENWKWGTGLHNLVHI